MERQDELEENERVQVTVKIKDFCRDCGLEVLVGNEQDFIGFNSVLVNRPGLLLAGFEDYFGSHRVQIIGNAEHYYFRSLTEELRERALERLFSQHIPCVIFTRGISPWHKTLNYAEKYNVPVLSSSQTTTAINFTIARYLNDMLAPTQSMHGTLMDIGGTGVLITGNSGMGKSEAALELVHRGHRLVADDAVIVKRVGDELVGRAPDSIKFFMEVRGIGVIDVRSMFGVGSVLDNDDVNLVIQLEKWRSDAELDRLGDCEQTENILGIMLPKLTIPVMPGRNLAIVVEVAARNYRLKKFGYNAVESLMERLHTGRGNE